jgi:hypothetical protein
MTHIRYILSDRFARIFDRTGGLFLLAVGLLTAGACAGPGL